MDTGMTRLLALPLALFVAASAAQAGPPPAIALPDGEELAEFAVQNWDDWGARLARFAGRTGEPSEPVRVDRADCAYLSGHWPNCDVTITAQFGDGTLVTRTLPVTFERDRKGRLEEVIIMFHPRHPVPEPEPVELPQVN